MRVICYLLYRNADKYLKPLYLSKMETSCFSCSNRVMGRLVNCVTLHCENDRHVIFGITRPTALVPKYMYTSGHSLRILGVNSFCYILLILGIRPFIEVSLIYHLVPREGMHHIK